MKNFKSGRLALLLMAIGMTTASAQTSTASPPDLHKMVDAYLTGVAGGYWEAREAKVQALKTPADISARQRLVRETYINLLGGFPNRTPLNPIITETLKRPGYRIEKLVFESQPGFYVTANVYVPGTGTGPYPAVLGTAGHSSGGKAEATYQTAWISLVRAGYVVLAFDEIGLGERVQYWDPQLGRSRVGIASAEHTVMGMQSLLVGINLGMYAAWDGIRGVDYLTSRPDVDPKRIAVVGNSGGGHQSAVMAMVDPRLAVAAPSCWLTSSKALWELFMPQDAEQNVAGFLSHDLDYGDFGLSFAPKPFMFETATQDFFPIAGAHATFAEDKRIYETLGHPERLGFFEYDDEHGWSKPRRESTYEWLNRWLMQKSGKVIEEAITAEPEAALSATSNGQVSTSLFSSKTVPMLTRERAEKLALERKPLDAKLLKAVLRTRLGITSPADTAVAPPAVTTTQTLTRDGFKVVKISIATEPGIQVPVLVSLPSGEAKRRPLVIYADSAGKDAAARSGRIETLVHDGNIVLVPDLRGWGEGESVGGSAPHTAKYETTMRAFIVGKTMVGMQVTDLRRLVDYAVTRPDVDAHHIRVIGRGNGGIVALFAAALDSRIGAVICEDSLSSYTELATRTYYDQSSFDTIIPGVLLDFDLPDVAAAIAPRPLRLVGSRLATGDVSGLAETEAAYARTARAYESMHEATQFRIVEHAKPDTVLQ